jgi:hypothetical protein
MPLGDNLSIFTTRFGKHSASPINPVVVHAVVVKFAYGGSTDLTQLFDLEKKLTEAINAAKAGEFDGNEVATDGSDGTLYMYGPDADRLLATVQPVLEACSFMRGARVTLRYGPPAPDVRKRQIVLGS